MNVPELTALIATGLDASVPLEKRRAALIVLDSIGIATLPITDEQKVALIWEAILMGPIPETEQAKAQRLAREDKERRFCPNCFLKQEPITEEPCTRCGQDEGEWVSPSALSGAEGRELRVSCDLGQKDREKLTERLYLSSDSKEADIKRARLILRIFDACGWPHPSPPYGNHNSSCGQFFLTPQEAPLVEPRVPLMPGSGNAVYHLPTDFSNLQVW